jgi:hypothetical protein
MARDLKDGTRVRTVKPEHISDDWQPGAHAKRRWGIDGVVVGYSDSHGLIYEVMYADRETGWFEPRELRPLDASSFLEVEKKTVAEEDKSTWGRLRKPEL